MKLTEEFKFRGIYNKAIIYRAIKAGNQYVILWNFDGEQHMNMSEEEMQHHFEQHEYELV